MKQFTYAGVSRLNGELKLRFTTSDARFLHLVKVGHTEVEMIKLTKPLDKDSAIKELLSRNFDNGRTEITNLLVGKARGATVKKNTVVIKAPAKAIKELAKKQAEDNEVMTAAEARKIRNAWNKANAHLSYDGE
jgi:hypothetical protein